MTKIYTALPSGSRGPYRKKKAACRRIFPLGKRPLANVAIAMPVAMPRDAITFSPARQVELCCAPAYVCTSATHSPSPTFALFSSDPAASYRYMTAPHNLPGGMPGCRESYAGYQQTLCGRAVKERIKQ